MHFRLISLIFLPLTALTVVVEQIPNIDNSTGLLASAQFVVNDHVYDDIYRAATYAALSYCTKYDRIILGNLKEACPCRLCYEAKDGIFVEHIYKGKVSGVVFRDDNVKEIIFAIKGTTTNEEWLIDFKIMPIPYHPLSKRKKGWSKFWKFNSKCKGCTIHKGFYDGAKIIYDNLFDTVLQLLEEYDDYNLIITGHSLGGAMAPIIANEFLLLKRHVNVVTFGSPKIGNKYFSNWMDESWNTAEHYDDINSIFHSNSYLRVTHNTDLVPLLPTRQMGYKHSGINVCFDSNDVPVSDETVNVTNFTIQHLSEQKEAELDEKITEVVENTKAWETLIDPHRIYFLRMNRCSS